jgi:hypothetical protein
MYTMRDRSANAAYTGDLRTVLLRSPRQLSFSQPTTGSLCTDHLVSDTDFVTALDTVNNFDLIFAAVLFEAAPESAINTLASPVACRF